jgi:hypothetical protein
MSDHVPSRIYDDGFKAYGDGRRIIDNPHEKSSDNWNAWQEGWKQNWWEHIRQGD